MAEQALVQARMDKELRDEVAKIYEELGLDLPTAIRMFFVRSRLVRGIPFETTLPERRVTREEGLRAWEQLRRQASELPEMTLDEINAEIAAARAERKAGGA